MSSHHWQFFRAGGVDQVSLRNKDDLLGLADLDQKLWVALAMPTRDIDVDPATLDLLDADKDGRIRVLDIRAAVKWIGETWVDVNQVLKGGDALRIDAIKEGKVRTAAERILRDLGKKGEAKIALADATGVSKAFATTIVNGDGIIIAESAPEGPLRQVIVDILATMGSVADRSGKPGVDQPKIDQFFDEIGKLAEWARSIGGDASLEDAAVAYLAIKDKIDEYFQKCQLAALDPEFAATASKVTATDPESIERMPLARVEAQATLPLGGAVNPAWEARLDALAHKAVLPLMGPRVSLSEDDVKELAGKLAGYLGKRAGKPTTVVEKLGMERVIAIADALPDEKPAIQKLLDEDKAAEPEYAEIEAVEKMLRFQRDFGRVLRNFVSFSDFYSKSDGVFQAGTLYIDGRACHLCVAVTDAGRHGALAGMSSAYLAYCDLRRGSETRTIVAAVTNGDADHLFVGRNGVFYDRKGQDWDATVSKIVANPISVREAFWAPYKKLVRMIEDQVGKRAQAAEAAADAKTTAAAAAVASADKTVSAPVPPPPQPSKKIDIGTVAAIGVAIGGIGALLVGILSMFVGLGVWMPIGIVALFLMISGPSMILAWMKLRQRNLGPILDANGWAVNGRARINVAFGAALTELAALPKGAKRSLDDPYADKKSRLRFYIPLLLLLTLSGTWYVGKLDKYLPQAVKSTKVLGENAPATSTVPLVPAPKV